MPKDIKRSHQVADFLSQLPLPPLEDIQVRPRRKGRGDSQQIQRATHSAVRQVETLVRVVAASFRGEEQVRQSQHAQVGAGEQEEMIVHCIVALYISIQYHSYALLYSLLELRRDSCFGG